jgi:hypothetical protein
MPEPQDLSPRLFKLLLELYYDDVATLGDMKAELQAMAANLDGVIAKHGEDLPSCKIAKLLADALLEHADAASVRWPWDSNPQP